MTLIVVLVALSVSGVFGGYLRESEIQPFSKGFGDNRILNGKEAALGQFPHQGALFYAETFICGCSLLNEYYALTAGHCTDGMNALNFEVIFGITRLLDQETTHQRIRVSNTHVHPSFNSRGLLNDDISVVKLGFPVVFTDFVKPIRLARGADSVPKDARVVASGWGRTSDNLPYELSPVLRFVELRALSQEVCRNYYSHNIINDRILCAIEENTAGTCNGDSGGPLVLQTTDGPVQVGITSFHKSIGCSYLSPSGFTRISSHIDFIESVINGSTAAQ